MRNQARPRPLEPGFEGDVEGPSGQRRGHETRGRLSFTSPVEEPGQHQPGWNRQLARADRTERLHNHGEPWRPPFGDQVKNPLIPSGQPGLQRQPAEPTNNEKGQAGGREEAGAVLRIAGGHGRNLGEVLPSA